MIAYCEDPICQRGHLLRYFGEALSREFRCRNCSACAGGAGLTGQAAAEDEAARIFRLNREAFEMFGLMTAKSFAQFLAASRSRRLPPQWRRLRGFGALENTPMPVLQEIAAPSDGGQLRLTRVSPKLEPPAASQPVADSPRDGEAAAAASRERILGKAIAVIPTGQRVARHD